MLKRFAGAGELLLPINHPALFHAVSIECSLGVGGLNKAVENLAALLVVVRDFLPDSRADDFANGHLFGERIEGVAAKLFARGSGVDDEHFVLLGGRTRQFQALVSST